jgi:hypothetical protein
MLLVFWVLRALLLGAEVLVLVSWVLRGSLMPVFLEAVVLVALF